MKRLITALLAALALCSGAAAQPFPGTLPPSTVIGRLGTSAGPSQAIPFATLGPLLGSTTGPNPTVVGNIVTWANTLGTSLGAGIAPGTNGNCLVSNGTAWISGSCGSVLASNNTWTGNNYFKSGSPWVDVKAYGALGDGSTDDTAAIQAAITAAPSLVYFPPGNYCIKTAGGISVTTPGLKLTGPNDGTGMILQTCGVNTKLLTINADSVDVGNMAFLGAGLGASAGNNAITIGSACVRCVLRDNTISGGNNVVSIAAQDVTIWHNRIDTAYGNAIILVQGAAAGAYFMRDEIDQNWPVSIPTAGSISSSISAWTNGHAYNVGDVATSGGYIIQARIAGTSAAGAPTLQNYGVDISDGSTLKWRLVASTTLYGINLDTGSVNNFIETTDISGPYTASVALTNSLAGTAPVTTSIRDSTMGLTTAFGVYAQAGAELIVRGSQIQQIIVTGGIGIYLPSTWTGSATLDGGNLLYNLGGAASSGIVVSGGTHVTIANNQVTPNLGTGILVSANVNDVTIIGNHAGSTSFGATAACITITTGTSDYINVIGNDCNGASVTGILATSVTGVHNRIDRGNVWTAYTPTIACGSGTITTLGTVTGAFYDEGPKRYVELVIPITTNGTCAGAVTATLPTTPASLNYVLVGREQLVSGALLSGTSTATNVFQIVTTANLYPAANNTKIIVDGWYRLN